MGAASLYFEGQERKRPRALAPGFYEDSRALLTTLDFVMPPAGKGPLSDGPLHPRAPGGLRLPWTPNASCAAFLRRAASLRRWRASGDLPG